MIPRLRNTDCVNAHKVTVKLIARTHTRKFHTRLDKDALLLLRNLALVPSCTLRIEIIIAAVYIYLLMSPIRLFRLHFDAALAYAGTFIHSCIWRHYVY